MNNDIELTLGTKAGKYGGVFNYELTRPNRARHIYIIGKTGSGKSTFLNSLVMQDIYAGRGVCFIDPHGDVAERLADSIPPERRRDTIYFNASDREHVIGFNTLQHSGSADDAELVASETVTLFKGLFRDSWGEWLEYLLKNATLTVLAQKNEPVSLVSIMRVLTDSNYRNRLVSKLTDPVIIDFWDSFFDRLRDRDELDKISSTLNKVGKMALSPVLRNVLGQSKSGFDIKQVMDNKQILIVNLSKGRIGADNANFLGSAILSKVVSTALRRSAIPERERVPFDLFIDEFQNFTSEEITTVVSEARKYALSLTLANQNFSQLKVNVLERIIKDVGSIVAFKVGYGDEERIARAFDLPNPSVLADTDDGTFWVRSGAGEAQLIKGFHPDELEELRCGSLQAVIKNTRWRFSRPRLVVEKQFNAWYSDTVKKKTKIKDINF